MRRNAVCCLGLSLALLGGCVSQPSTFFLQPRDEPGNGAPLVWPQPPDQSRYAYVGQLLGEQNFRTPGEEQSTAEKVVRWLVGLGSVGREPTVLRRPNAIEVGPGGRRIYVTDMGRPSVFVFDTATPELQVWDRAAAGEPFIAPSGIAALPGGDVLVADAERGAVFRLDAMGRPQARFGDGQLERPGGVAWHEGRGEIFVTDVRAHDIEVFDSRGQHLRTLGGPGVEPGRFNAPSHVTVAGDDIYVTDTFNARVQRLTPYAEPVETFGQRGLYVGNLVRPKGVAVDHGGRVYVVESYYGQLLVFDAEGRFLLPVSTAGTALGDLYLPAGVAVDNRQRVYLVDMFNGRVLVLQYLDQETELGFMDLQLIYEEE